MSATEFKIFTIQAWIVAALNIATTTAILVVWYYHGFWTAIAVNLILSAGVLIGVANQYAVQRTTARNFGFVTIGTTVYKVEDMMSSRPTIEESVET